MVPLTGLGIEILLLKVPFTESYTVMPQYASFFLSEYQVCGEVDFPAVPTFGWDHWKDFFPLATLSSGRRRSVMLRCTPRCPWGIKCKGEDWLALAPWLSLLMLGGRQAFMTPAKERIPALLASWLGDQHPHPGRSPVSILTEDIRGRVRCAY